jgi:hypothetical protein
MLKKNQFDALVFQFGAGAAHYDLAILIKFVKLQYSTRFLYYSTSNLGLVLLPIWTLEAANVKEKSI